MADVIFFDEIDAGQKRTEHSWNDERSQTLNALPTEMSVQFKRRHSSDCGHKQVDVLMKPCCAQDGLTGRWK